MMTSPVASNPQLGKMQGVMLNTLTQDTLTVTDVAVARLNGESCEIVQGDSIAFVATASFRYVLPPAATTKPGGDPASPTDGNEPAPAPPAAPGVPTSAVLFSIDETGEVQQGQCAILNDKGAAVAQTHLEAWLIEHYAFDFNVVDSASGRSLTAGRDNVLQRTKRTPWIRALDTNGMGSELVAVTVDIKPKTPPVAVIVASPPKDVTTEIARLHADYTRVICVLQELEKKVCDLAASIKKSNEST